MASQYIKLTPIGKGTRPTDTFDVRKSQVQSIDTYEWPLSHKWGPRFLDWVASWYGEEPYCSTEQRTLIGVGGKPFRVKETREEILKMLR